MPGCGSPAAATATVAKRPLAARDKAPPHPIAANPRLLSAEAGAAQGGIDSEIARAHWIKTHLAFGDARTVATLDPPDAADKE